MAKLLGTVKDDEDYKQKIIKQRKLHKKTITVAKNYLSSDEAKFLETKMLEENSNPVQSEFMNSNKMVFEQDVYRYLFKIPVSYKITIAPNNHQIIRFEQAVEYFLDNYAKLNCTKRTYETYESIFRTHVVPFFRGKTLNNITNLDIEQFYNYCVERHLQPRRLKNTLTQLNQLIKYYQNLGIIDKNVHFKLSD